MSARPSPGSSNAGWRGWQPWPGTGAHLLIDDGFLSGPAAHARWAEALHGLDVVWIGVRLAPHLAAVREARRGDREVGMAAAQADSVHRGIHYDLEVDTSSGSPAELAQTLASQIAALSRLLAAGSAASLVDTESQAAAAACVD